METKELKLLDSSEFKVLKQITLISDRPNSEYEIGTILYSRPLTPTYNFKKQEQEDRTTTPMQRLLQEYPNKKNTLMIGLMKLSSMRLNRVFLNQDLEILQFYLILTRKTYGI